jgi:hypothetical protein
MTTPPARQASPPAQPPAAPTRAERRRAFAREIAGIVLGVLIALALGAVAAAIGWQIDAIDARRALSLELGEIRGQAEERVLARDCIEQRLDSVATVLDQAEASGQLPPLGPIGDPPFLTWSTGVWDSTISADIASQGPRAARQPVRRLRVRAHPQPRNPGRGRGLDRPIRDRRPGPAGGAGC